MQFFQAMPPLSPTQIRPTSIMSRNTGNENGYPPHHPLNQHMPGGMPFYPPHPQQHPQHQHQQQQQQQSQHHHSNLQPSPFQTSAGPHSSPSQQHHHANYQPGFNQPHPPPPPSQHHHQGQPQQHQSFHPQDGGSYQQGQLPQQGYPGQATFLRTGSQPPPPPMIQPKNPPGGAVRPGLPRRSTDTALGHAEEDVKPNMMVRPSGSVQSSPQAPRHVGVGEVGDEAGNAAGGQQVKKTGASDFVKKLYKMLEDDECAKTVSWGVNGDTFVVKDMSEFCKTILPRHFKHSNFASFVRQLNKYDFHKVKNPDDVAYDQHLWEFRHDNFRMDTKHSLENIKRKGPTGKKIPNPNAVALRTNQGPSSENEGALTTRTPNPELKAIQAQLDNMNQVQHSMNIHMTTLTRDYQGVISELLNFQRNMVAQDQLMQNLIQYLVNLEAEKKGDTTGSGSGSIAETPFVPSDQAQKLISSYTEVAKASFEQMQEISRRASVTGSSFLLTAGQNSSQAMFGPPLPPDHPQRANGGQASSSRTSSTPRQEIKSSPSSSSVSQDTYDDQAGPSVFSPQSQQQTPNAAALCGLFEGHPPHHDATASSSGTDYAPGLRVFTVGHLRPRETGDDDPGFFPDEETNGLGGYGGLQVPTLEELPRDMPRLDGTNGADGKTSPATEGFNPRDAAGSLGQRRTSQTLRVRRSTYVPGWAVPPKVLLVEDDAVCRKLSSKFLQVFGCEIDVAVDGMVAVNKMNLDKYDLVLMDIVMPNMDGVSATSLIRRFDAMTPIISMTSNSNPNEIMNYFSSGMNDILPKPFTKEGLLGMLEKHLIHLKVMQHIAEIPRSLGSSETKIHNALAASISEITGENPFSSMGVSESDYYNMLQGLMNPEPSSPMPGGKRGLAQAGVADGENDEPGSGGSGDDGPGDVRVRKKGRFSEITD